MIDIKVIEEIAHKMANALPPGLKDFPEETEKHFKSLLQSLFSKLDLVSREEFDVQSKVLLRTREKLENIEQKVMELEAKNSKDSS